MRYITAPQVHNGYGFLPSSTVVAVLEDGSIAGLIPFSEVPGGPSCIEQHEGILCPSFVNVHCHLELSHLYRRVPEHTGLVEFVSRIPLVRKEDNAVLIREAIMEAARQMYDNGIIAVGDISNTTDTLAVRDRVPLHMHTFIECMGIIPELAGKRFEASQAVYEAYKATGKEGPYLRRVTIVPHAPYSVSRPLLERIAAASGAGVLSVHNQESEAELRFFADRSGDLLQLYKALQIDAARLDIPGTSSLEYIVSGLSEKTPLILVHNTFTSEKDIVYLQHRHPDVSFCLCPNANWYIERRLPDIPMLERSGFPICLGTDSLASNYGLDIYAEVLVILKHFPSIPMETVLRWATLNGAKALQMDDIIGSLEPGKRPGLNLITPDNQVVRLL